MIFGVGNKLGEQRALSRGNFSRLDLGEFRPTASARRFLPNLKSLTAAA